jgi:hypothetical protein
MNVCMLDQTGLEIAQSGKPGFGVSSPRDCWGRQTAGNQGLTQINAIGLLRVILLVLQRRIPCPRRTWQLRW